jgi:hypothetical protein
LILAASISLGVRATGTFVSLLLASHCVDNFVQGPFEQSLTQKDPSIHRLILHRGSHSLINAQICEKEPRSFFRPLPNRLHAIEGNAALDPIKVRPFGMECSQHLPDLIQDLGFVALTRHRSLDYRHPFSMILTPAKLPWRRD